MSRWAVLAARNLLRHRRRTFLTGSIVVVGFVAVTMTAGFVSQTFSGLKNATIRGVGGHLRLLDPRAAGKTDDEASTILLEDWPGLAGLLSRDPHVVQAMPKLSFFGLVVKGEKSAAYLGTGTIPALEKQASLAADTVQSGAFLANPEADEIMLGTGIARAIDAKVGDLVTVMTTTPEGGINAVDATVAAILSYPVKELDDRILYMPYAAAARLLKAEGKANSVVVLLRDDRDTERESVDLPKALAAAGPARRPEDVARHGHVLQAGQAPLHLDLLLHGARPRGRRDPRDREHDDDVGLRAHARDRHAPRDRHGARRPSGPCSCSRASSSGSSGPESARSCRSS